MVVRFDSGDVRVNGMIQVSRKSAKVLNAVLRTYTDCTVASVEGCWVLESKDGQRIPMTGIMATVPMTRKAKTCKMDKYITH
jgi:hypothetical protein